MTGLHTHLTPMMACPACRAVMTAAGTPEPGRGPQPDDLSFCTYCETPLVFEGMPAIGQLVLRLATPVEIIEHAEEFAHIRAVVADLKQRRGSPHPPRKLQ